jgi:hypothetical protein
MVWQGPLNRDTLGQWAHDEVARNGSAAIPFDTLATCELGYPYMDRHDGILRWWSKPVLDAWLDRWTLHALPVCEGDTMLVVVQAVEHRP